MEFNHRKSIETSGFLAATLQRRSLSGQDVRNWGKGSSRVTSSLRPFPNGVTFVRVPRTYTSKRFESTYINSNRFARNSKHKILENLEVSLIDIGIFWNFRELQWDFDSAMDREVPQLEFSGYFLNSPSVQYYNIICNSDWKEHKKIKKTFIFKRLYLLI